MAKSDKGGKVAVVTGAGGTLCSEMSIALAQNGYKVALLGRDLSKLEKVEHEIRKNGGHAISLSTDVTNEGELENSKLAINEKLGPCNVLINGAGGNQLAAVTSLTSFDKKELMDASASDGARGFFNLDMHTFQSVLQTNTMGTVIPSRIFGRDMAENGGGSIINMASMTSFRPLSRVAAYAMAKAAIVNFTQWLAAYLAPANIRVNAIAPGFFVNERSKKILYNPDGTNSARGENVLHHTPMKRYGEAKELIGCMNWLIDENASGFVTGIVVPVDGGFLADAGV
ncbi:MAG: SDR family NAD(P)-dependent oxidoreductase [Cyclobacteriaceae bacterium]|nr:SDR family NAD(P)-dependent oxidoreductase [Cyclobacteriaceae bacterium]